MNLIESAPEWAFYGFAAMLVLAALQDGWKLTISNLLTGGLLLLGIVVAFMSGIELAIWQNVAVLLAILFAGAQLHSMGWMGGGDVKLLGAAGFWFSAMGALHMIIAVVLGGGVLTIIVLSIRMIVGSAKEGAIGVIRKGSGMPYGIAIAAGAIGMAAYVRDLI